MVKKKIEPKSDWDRVHDTLTELEDRYLEQRSKLEDALEKEGLIEDLQERSAEYERAVELLHEALPLARQAAKQYSPHGLESRTVRSIEVFLEGTPVGRG